MALLHCGIVLVAATSVLVPSHPPDSPIMRKLPSAHPPVTYSVQQAERYLTADQIAYIRPGLKINIQSVSIGADNKPVVQLTFTDDLGQPLDRAGVLTPGILSISFILARYDAANIDYIDYSTSVQTSPITGVSATQAAADSRGTWNDTALGQATYTFGTALPAGFDTTATHTLGIYATRNISLTDPFVISKLYVDNEVYDFRPDGQAVTDTWDATTFATCNQCHDPLAAHGSTGRRNPRICVLCHNDTQSLDPDTGNTVNFKVMIHKIHMGKDLPSVQAGHPYQIIGYRQSVADFSTVAFPQDIRNCATCHKSPDPTGKAVSQANIWYSEPNRAACGSCHDDINWETGENHPAGPELDDADCATCHLPEGVTEFDASIKGAHTIPTKSTQLPGLVLQILSVTDTAPGEKPTVMFKLTNKAGQVLDPTKLNRFGFIVGGPTTDYASYFRESLSSPTCGGDTCTYTFKTAIPADATGTWTLAADYYKTVIIDNHTDAGLSVRDAGQNPIFNFIVTDAQTTARRQVVDLAKCNKCHDVLALHGGQRFKVEECVICHNPNATAESVEGEPDESIHLKWMIHRIHTGEELSHDFTIGGTNFNEVRFPGDRRDCQQCHLAGTYTVPLPDGVLPTITPRDYYTPMQPTAAACLSCHDTASAAAHAFTMTTTFSEACEVCHASDAEFGVDKVHAR